MATIFTRWIARRRERKAREETYAAPPPPTDSVKILQPTGETGTTITYISSGGGGAGAPTPTPTPTPTPSQIPSSTTLRGVTIPSSIDIATQEKLRGEAEIYDPRTGAYKISPYGYGAGGTARERYPTPKEQRKIDIAQERGELGYQLTGVSQKEFEELSKLQDKISSSSIKLEDLGKEFENKYNNLIEENKFIGTKEQYKQYEKDFNKLNRENIKLEGNIARYKSAGGTISKEGIIEMPKVTIGGGIGKYKGRKVDLYKFSGLYSPSVGVQASAGVGFFARTGGQVIGESLGKVLGKRKYVLAEARDIPEKTLEGIYQPQFGTATEFDPLTGRAKAKFEDVKIEAKTRPELYFTGEQLGEQVGTILGGVGEGAKYLVPYTGGLFFASEVVEEAKRAGGVKEYIKEKPVEAALLGSVVLGAGAVKGVQLLKGVEATKVSQQLLRLSERPIKYLEVIEKGKGQVKLRAIQESERLKREIRVVGKLGKTEKGFEFIPEARGFAVTTGEVKGLARRKRELFRLDVFATGTKGTAIPYRSIGDIIQYKTFGLSTYEPLGSTYALYKRGAKFIDIEKQLQKQVKLRGEVTKEIYTGDIFGLKRDLFLGVKRDREIGLTFIKKAKEAKDIKMIKGKRKTPFIQTYKEEYAQQIIKPEIIRKGLVKQIREVPTPTKEVVKGIELRELPLMVGGAGLKTLPKPSYATLGVYEEQMLLPTTQLKGVIQPSFVEFKERELQREIPVSISKEITKVKQKEELKSILDIKPTQKYLQPQKEALKEVQLFKQALELKQVKKERLAQIQRARQVQKPIKPLEIIIPLKLGEAMTRIKTIAKEKPEVFSVFGRRFGEEVKLGVFPTKTKAEKKLEKFLVKTLGAAGFVTKEGKKLKAEELELLKKKGFRPSKISEFLVIEEKEKRLRKKTTGKEIQFFRKSGRRKGKSLFGI